MQPVVVFGAGGHAKTVIDVLRHSGAGRPVACLASAESKGCLVNGVPVVGDDTCLPSLRRSGIEAAIVAVGDNDLRCRLMQYVRQHAMRLINAISPAATISPSAFLGQGVVVMPGAVVAADSYLGDGVIVNTRASVDHDCRLETGAHLAPGATLAGCVTLQTGSMVGVGASVVPGIVIRQRAIVGAGAVVIHDIPPNVIALGVPARVHRLRSEPSSQETSKRYAG